MEVDLYRIVDDHVHAGASVAPAISDGVDGAIFRGVTTFPPVEHGDLGHVVVEREAWIRLLLWGHQWGQIRMAPG